MKKFRIVLIITMALLLTGGAVRFFKIYGKRSSAGKDFRENTVYFLLTDRFADGDKNNNDIYGDEYIPGDLKFYQGGDFRGLIDNLDYIKDMGFSAIWITPPVCQPPGAYTNSSETYSAAGYHGYWAWDFSKIDPHLESEGATYQDLIKAAHAKGLKVIQDIVANHAHGGDVSPKVKWADGHLQVSGLGQTYDFGKDTQNWFTHEGPVLADLLDFNDKNPKTEQWLADIYKKYQDMGVDAFRVDTLAWMRPEFWKFFADELHRHKKDFFIFGEYWTNDDYAALSGFTKMSDGDMMNSSMSVLDMPGSAMGGWGLFEKVFKGGDYSDIDAVLEHDKDYKDASYLVTFLDNHDKPRFNSPASPASEQQYIDALNYYFTARGIPCVYYGTEIGMSGGDEPDNRKMLGEDNIKKAPTNPIYKRIKELNAIRRSDEALQKGSQTKLSSSRDQYAFRRDYKGHSVYVYLNKSGTAEPAVMELPAGEYKDLASGTVYTSDGRPVLLEVGAHSARVMSAVPRRGFLSRIF